MPAPHALKAAPPLFKIMGGIWARSGARICIVHGPHSSACSAGHTLRVTRNLLTTAFGTWEGRWFRLKSGSSAIRETLEATG